MKTSRMIPNIENGGTKLSTARRRRMIAGLVLTTLIAAGVATATHADTSSSPPASECSDFACER